MRTVIVGTHLVVQLFSTGLDHINFYIRSAGPLI